MITCALLINQACQENYEMVDPPLITGTDDLDEEVIIPEDLECYYVSHSSICFLVIFSIEHTTIEV